ncbi:MAG: hypothetical protein RBU21_06430 [FCB group bacterium]|jgi:hypothetical protein|nr:hypothetical protein [FCB group bacterium]
MKHIQSLSAPLPCIASAKGSTKECSTVKDSLGLCTETKSPV